MVVEVVVPDEVVSDEVVVVPEDVVPEDVVLDDVDVVSVEVEVVSSGTLARACARSEEGLGLSPDWQASIKAALARPDIQSCKAFDFVMDPSPTEEWTVSGAVRPSPVRSSERRRTILSRHPPPAPASAPPR